MWAASSSNSEAKEGGGIALLECTRCEHRIEWEESADDDRCKDRRGHRDKAIRKQIIFKVISSGA